MNIPVNQALTLAAEYIAKWQVDCPRNTNDLGELRRCGIDCNWDFAWPCLGGKNADECWVMYYKHQIEEYIKEHRAKTKLTLKEAKELVINELQKHNVDYLRVSARTLQYANGPRIGVTIWYNPNGREVFWKVYDDDGYKNKEYAFWDMRHMFYTKYNISLTSGWGEGR